MDLDPKYNASCAGTDGGEREYMSALCVGRNIGDSLDFGVTTFLYDGLFKNEEGEVNILHDMFPLTARRLDEGLIVGRERVIVRAFLDPILRVRAVSLKRRAPADQEEWNSEVGFCGL